MRAFCVCKKVIATMEGEFALDESLRNMKTKMLLVPAFNPAIYPKLFYHRQVVVSDTQSH